MNGWVPGRAGAAKVSRLRPGTTTSNEPSSAVRVTSVVVALCTVTREPGATVDAQLRLITCGGAFDPGARSYEDNVIAFATLVGTRPA